VAFLTLVVMAAVHQASSRITLTLNVAQRLALGGGAGFLSAGVAAALSAPLMISRIGWGRIASWPAAETFWYLLVLPAAQFGALAGIVATGAGMLAGSGHRRLSPARIPSNSRRRSMASLAQAPRRGSVFGPQPVTSGALWSAPDITRTLCAAVRIDSVFRRQVLDLLTQSRLRAITPSLGVDLRPVLRHAVEADHQELRRDLRRLIPLGMAVLWPIVAEILLGISEWVPLLAPPLLLLTLSLPLMIAAVALAIEFQYFWAIEGSLAELHEARRRSDEPIPVPPMPQSPAMIERLTAIDEAQRGLVTVSGHLRPFEGMGETLDSWRLTLPLTRTKLASAKKLPVNHSPEDPVLPISEPKLIAAVRDRLTAVDDSQRRFGFPGVHVEERFFVNGASLREHELLLPAVGEPVRVLLSPDDLASAAHTNSNTTRRYLVSRIASWNGHIVTSTLLRVCTDGGFLQVECEKTVERPLSSHYRALVTGGTGDARPSLGLVLTRSAGTFLVGMLVAPFALLGRALETWAQRRLRRREEHQACTERDFDYGALSSVRALASASEALTSYQFADVERQFRLIDRAVLLAVTDFLESSGLDISELRNYQMTILNHGVIQTGGVSMVGNQAVGVGAGVSGSSTTVMTKQGDTP